MESKTIGISVWTQDPPHFILLDISPLVLEGVQGHGGRRRTRVTVLRVLCRTRAPSTVGVTSIGLDGVQGVTSPCQESERGAIETQIKK